MTIEVGGGGFWAGVTNLAFDDNGTKIVATSLNGPVAMFDSTSGEQVEAFVGHTGKVTDAAVSPDGKVLATTGLDGTIRLWDTSTGEETLRIEDSQAFTSVDFSENGSQLLVAGDFGVRVYEVNTQNLIDLARSRLLRWWTPEECFQYLGTTDCPVPPSG
jgi:WD40 repeat protein